MSRLAHGVGAAPVRLAVVRLNVVRRALVCLVVVAVSGCTVGGADPEGTPTPPGTSSPAEADGAEPTGSEAVGPDAADLSAEIFAAAEQQPDPLAGQTLEVPRLNGGGETGPVTVEVLAVDRRPHSTLVTVTMTTTEETFQPASDALGDRLNAEFFFRIALEDPAAGVRYLPLSYRWDSFDATAIPDQPVNGCLCAYAGGNFTLSPEPLVMDVLYPPLPPEVTSVTMTAPDGLAIPDLPVAEPAG